MIKHYIIMSSSYTDGSRVALDITEDCFLNSKAIAEMIEEIRKNCGKDVPLSCRSLFAAVRDGNRDPRDHGYCQNCRDELSKRKRLL